MVSLPLNGIRNYAELYYTTGVDERGRVELRKKPASRPEIEFLKIYKEPKSVRPKSISNTALFLLTGRIPL